MKYISKVLIPLLFIVILISGCKKYLDEKSNDSLVIVDDLQDLQSLLDNYNLINRSYPSADEVSTDEYYLAFSDFQSLTLEQMRNMYTWQPSNIFWSYTNTTNDWAQIYNKLYIANTVLDNITKVERTADNAAAWDNIKGQALFLRGYCFYTITSIWSLAYDEASANSDLGIPLRLNSDFNEQSRRSTVMEAYNQIISDTKKAASLLSNTTTHVIRGSKPAAYALLSRTYLSMRKFDLSGLYADSCLQLNNTLIDFNSLNSSLAYPIPQFNKEVVFSTTMGGSGTLPIASVFAKIDSTLYSTYSANDLRKQIFFTSNVNGFVTFKGSYDGSSSLFNGLAIDEVYLIRAESFARAGNYVSAMNDLNRLLQSRFRAGSYVPKVAFTSNDALDTILAERRKELIMRGTRWIDIKRLNKEGAGIVLKRNLNGKTYTLPPNDLRYALPIPDDIISLSGIQQNPR